jgi:hypothetical protein
VKADEPGGPSDQHLHRVSLTAGRPRPSP